MPNGLLRVRGTLDVGQFWPHANSDADTTKVLINVGSSRFEFEPYPGAGFRRTRAFDDAVVVGSGGRRIEPVRNGQLTVRLQGIDAPELHYRPVAEVKTLQQTKGQRRIYLELNEDYRQPLAETATLKLAARLGSSTAVLDCEVRTAVDTPDDVFDTYGRFVGDVTARIERSDVIINEWLLREGWALPSFYSSMSSAEIERLMALATSARSRGRGVWPSYVNLMPTTLRAFSWKRVYRKKGAQPDPVKDAGDLINPKLFRRLATWAVNRRARMVSAAFLRYLASKTADLVHETEEFLIQGPAAAPVRHLADLVDRQGRLSFDPEDVVFREKPSRLAIPGGGTATW